MGKEQDDEKDDILVGHTKDGKPIMMAPGALDHLEGDIPENFLDEIAKLIGQAIEVDAKMKKGEVLTPEQLAELERTGMSYRKLTPEEEALLDAGEIEKLIELGDELDKESDE